MTSTDQQMAQRLAALEEELATFKRDHDAAHSDGVLTLEARLRDLRSRIENDLARGDQLGALHDELDRDLTGATEQFTMLVTGSGRSS